MDRLDEAQAAAGDNPDVRLARARLYAAEPGRVRPLAPLAERIESWPEAEQARLLFGLVEVFDAVGDHAAVVRTFRALAGRRPLAVAQPLPASFDRLAAWIATLPERGIELVPPSLLLRDAAAAPVATRD